MNTKIDNIQLVDQFARTISYLRLSLTDRCNLRCLYCMPADQDESDKHIKTGVDLAHSDLLTYEELLRVVRLTAAMGMNKLRLTGGEPLVRKGVLGFISSLFTVKGIDEVRLTTNGVLLTEYAEPLYKAGVRHLNISLDTLKPERFAKITGRDKFQRVWDGLALARDLGFKIKINIVAMKGVNDDEFRDFAALSLSEDYQVRFIEFMPVGGHSSWKKEQFITASEIQELVSDLGTLTPFRNKGIEGPARMYRLSTPDGREGSVGFISPISHHFCDKCNRLRLTSEGKFRACLLNDSETDIKQLLRNGASDDEISAVIRMTILNKPRGHVLGEDPGNRNSTGCQGQMSRIGG